MIPAATNIVFMYGAGMGTATPITRKTIAKIKSSSLYIIFDQKNYEGCSSFFSLAPSLPLN
jgi:hypothetical protein